MLGHSSNILFHHLSTNTSIRDRLLSCSWTSGRSAKFLLALFFSLEDTII